MSDERPGQRVELRLVQDANAETSGADERVVSRARYFADPSHPNKIPVFSAMRGDGSNLLQCYVFTDDPREIESAHVQLEALARELLDRDPDA